jgi:hypothetical protein
MALPTVRGKITVWEQTRLDARSELQIMLECAPLTGRQTFEADACEWVVEEYLRFDGFIANKADAKLAVLQTVEGFIDGVEQIRNLISVGTGGRCFEPCPPFQQLSPDYCLFRV